MKKELAVLLAVVLCAIAGVGHAATPLHVIISNDVPQGNLYGGLRVVHTSPDAGPLDVWIGGVLTFENVQFHEITAFAAFPPGHTPTVKIVPAGAAAPAVIDFVPFHYQFPVTLIVTGMRDSISAHVAPTEAGAAPPGMALVRAFNASPDTEAAFMSLVGGPVLSAWHEFGEWTYYQNAPGGTYDVKVGSSSGSDGIVLTVPSVTFAAGGVYTVYLTGLRADIGAASSRTFIPVAARGHGYPGSFWSTDVDVHNAGPTPARFTYEWLPRNSDNAQPLTSPQFTLQPGQALRHADVLAAAFGFADGADAFGALAVVSDSEHLLLYSRTSVRQDGSSSGYGMAVPGIAADRLIPANTRKRILFFTQDDKSRSNLGFLNGTAAPITIRWERFTADGAKVGEGAIDLAPFGNVQLNRVFLGEAPTAAAYLDVWTDTAGGAFAAWGAVVDNVTSDPVLVPPQ